MTDLLLAANTPSAIDYLRDDREQRPPRDSQSAIALRDVLSTTVLALVSPDDPLVVHPSSWRESPLSDPSSSWIGQLRGLLVVHGLRLLVVDPTNHVSYDDALRAWRAHDHTSPLRLAVDALESDDRARLAASVEAHLSTLAATIGRAAPTWLPRVNVRAATTLVGGRLVLRDVVDLMIGTTTTETASVVLVDITTAPLSEFATRLARYHALVQTLRTSVVPWRSAVLSTATGEFRVEEVDRVLLDDALGDLVDILSSRGTK